MSDADHADADHAQDRQLDAHDPAPKAEGVESLFQRLAGDTLAAKIDALHSETFTGSALAAAGTELWNLVHGFKERVKALLVDAARSGNPDSDHPDSSHHDL